MRTVGQTDKTKLFLILETRLRKIMKYGYIIFYGVYTEKRLRLCGANKLQLEYDRNIAVILNKPGLCAFHKHTFSYSIFYDCKQHYNLEHTVVSLRLKMSVRLYQSGTCLKYRHINHIIIQLMHTT